MNEEQRWDDLHELFHIPKACVNSSQALKQTYIRYVSLPVSLPLYVVHSCLLNGCYIRILCTQLRQVLWSLVAHVCSNVYHDLTRLPSKQNFGLHLQSEAPYLVIPYDVMATSFPKIVTSFSI